jgi:hypothetical protein
VKRVFAPLYAEPQPEAIRCADGVEWSQAELRDALARGQQTVVGRPILVGEAEQARLRRILSALLGRSGRVILLSRVTFGQRALGGGGRLRERLLLTVVGRQRQLLGVEADGVGHLFEGAASGRHVRQHTRLARQATEPRLPGREQNGLRPDFEFRGQRIERGQRRAAQLADDAARREGVRGDRVRLGAEGQSGGDGGPFGPVAPEVEGRNLRRVFVLLSNALGEQLVLPLGELYVLHHVTFGFGVVRVRAFGLGVEPRKLAEEIDH